MSIIQALIMGIVQGITEFLPISSSGHLVVIPWMFNFRDPGLSFDAGLHLGTMLAIICFFWKDWLDIIKNWKEPLFRSILIGCLPAAVIGLAYENLFETTLRSPILVAACMIALGCVLWLAEYTGRKNRAVKDVNLIDSIFIGLAQVLALIPGVSRSGITMTAGLFSGLDRESAARFSFLLASPVILGAGLFKLRYFFSGGLPYSDATPLIIGILSSAIVGFLSIKFLLQYLMKHSFKIFVWYRFIVGAVIIIVWMLRT
ncbi:MAG: undecaprenyl-diphosphatase UppP [Candidatus Saganbacteria bacterium]|nr:undecaprenyl-diphosphatase UppP [Candidatus Saganbacteria bacterium]